MWQHLMGLLWSDRPNPKTPLDRLLAQVEEEVEAALRVVEHWAPAVWQRQRPRLHMLRVAWAEQAAHLRTLERMLAESDVAAPGREHWRKMWQLGQAELLATLAWVRELASMVRLAWRAGAPEARAEELLGQIAAAAAGLSVAPGVLTDSFEK